MRRYEATRATPGQSEHAEGPTWDVRTGQLLWVDQYAGLVQVADYSPGQRRLAITRTYDVGAAVGAVVPTTEDDWLLAYASGFGRLQPDGTLTPLVQPAPAHVRMNDAKCDRFGRFWAGTMAWDKRPGAGSLYRLDPDGTLTVALEGVTISNGLAWDSQDHMYYIDTPTGRIDRFVVRDDGSLTDRTAVVGIEGGFPDGMCIDVDGCLWVAVWGGSCVRRYAPDGTMLAVVDVPAPQVSSCCLGGPDGRTLFITTSQEGMTAEQQDDRSGAIFVAEVDTAGEPAAPFGGPSR